MAHTKGPWRLENDGHVYILIGSSDEHLAEIELQFLNEFDTDSSGQFSRETGEANARMIAAAPDLLEAIKLSKKMLDIFLTNASQREAWGSELDLITSAIAKVEGVDGKG